jgi:hypothetical protein
MHDESLYTKEYIKEFNSVKDFNAIKVLHFGDVSLGAIGIINRDIKKIIDKNYPEIIFEMMDWADSNMYVKLFNQKEWKNWDIIIIDPILAGVLDRGWLFTQLPKEEQLQLRNKLIPVYHHEVDVPVNHFNHGWYEGWFTKPVCGINPYIVNQIKERGVESKLLPIGVNIERFKPFKKVKKIKKIGFVGNDDKEEWKFIKRPDLFQQICRAANVACKIPFISTKVGIVRYYDKTKTFSTIDEAVSIINKLNESEDNIIQYVDEMYDKMFPERCWENILEKYWVPYFKQLNLQNK